MEIEMFVELVVSDTTALTALHCLERIGFSQLKSLKRYDYYKFTADDDITQELGKVDILVNANKHRFTNSRPVTKANGLSYADILVEEQDEGTGLMETMKNRLGFKNIKDVKKGVFWKLGIEGNEEEARQTAEQAAKQLFSSKHYQKYTLF